ncbi:helix-turn-helix XRE domain protein [Geotalea daltonii FRC-32]|uniref:Helix-turn-helix XRE domain protein n=1 Tax=Geotalea daltonii (strain DSM 22248 / JCM 15807 / FRC-32) TaxID=316067 RepID=B9M387_GEODF|nr:helix-turn-helix transcriptional regulator [Geotalea daltonii]ACM19497.1 helix-turn-helix XRE domain protein [Geotalea daltonii FRC-32]
MHTEDLVQLALKTLSCSQKELAVRLGVSPTQISKWKNKEHMSHEMEEKFRKILAIGDKDPSFVLWAGSLQEANKWEKLIHFLAEIAIENAETGYNTYSLNDELRLLCWETFHVLREIGVDIPKKFPDELETDFNNVFTDGLGDEVTVFLEKNPYSALIYKIYISLNDVYGFYAAYIAELIDDDDLELVGTAADNIEPCLIDLAACKIDVDEAFAPKFREHRHKVLKDYEEWINIVKDRAFRTGVPLRAELLGLVFDSHDDLGHEAEAESLGFNASRIHPDIYINELLMGMRTIHQILPVIMKKLGIYDEFKLDTSELHVR